jgi:hypothetical protein
LVFLACYLDHDRNSTTDIAWWELYSTIPPTVPTLAVGLAVGLRGRLAGGLALGLAFGLAFGLEPTPVDLATAADPRAVLVRDRRAFLTAFVTVGIVCGLAIGLTLGLAGGVGLGFTGGLMLVFPLGLPLGLAVGLAHGFTRTAWGRFAIARCWLAVRRRLPWPLMSFLADAHQRGVLRQAGAMYQFRHAELQRRLATRS